MAVEYKSIQSITDVIIDYRGKTPPKTEKGIRLITAKVIKGGTLINDRQEFIAEDFYDEWMRRGLPQKWDILLTTEAPLGEVAQIRDNNKIALAQRVILLRGNPNTIDQQYFFQALKSPYVQSGLNARATGTTVSGIKQSELRKVEIPLPPLPIQRKIAGILSAYDDFIENNTRRIAILEEMAQRIYKEWFVDFKYPGHENDKLVDSGTEFGMIPEGWEVHNLNRLVSTQYGYTESSNSEKVGPKYIRGTDINKSSYIDWSKVPYCRISKSDHNKYCIAQNDILIIRMADPGKVGIIEKEIDAVFASYLIRIKLIENSITPYYLFYLLNSTPYQNYISGASTGTTRKSASAGVITQYNFVKPTSKFLSAYDEIVIPLRKQLNLLLDKNTNLRNARDLLLPKLISGQIDVSELDIDIGNMD